MQNFVSKDKEEIERCQKSPCYFYNNYVRKEGQKELTEDEYNDFAEKVNLDRQKTRNDFRPAYPLTHNEAFKIKTD